MAQPAADHAVGARLIERPALQFPAPPSAEERARGVPGNARRRPSIRREISPARDDKAIRLPLASRVIVAADTDDVVPKG